MNYPQQSFKVIFLVFFPLIIFSKQELVLNDQANYDSYVSTYKKIELYDLLSKYRVSLGSLGILTVLYFNYETLSLNIKNYPIPWFIGFCFFWNYMVDVAIKNCQIDQIKKNFLLFRAMSRNLLCMFAVRNTMQKLCNDQNKCFNEQDFLNMIIQATGRSIEELEKFTFELLKISTHQISSLESQTQTADIEEKVYFLCKNCITIKEMIIACKNDKDTYNLLIKFSLDPQNFYEKTMYQLCYIFSKKFSYFL